MSRTFLHLLYFPFYIGLLFLMVSCGERAAGEITHLPFQVTSGSGWGLLRTDGHICTAGLFDKAPSPVVNGLFSVPDSAGRLVLYRLAEGEMPVRVGTESYSQLGYFFGERTIAQKEPEAPLCLIDREGREVATLSDYGRSKVVMAHNFSEGLALVCTDEGKYGYVDEDGSMKIPPVYDVACDFSDGVALTGMSDVRGQIVFRVIDKQGKMLFPVRLQDCELAGGFVRGGLVYRDKRNKVCALLDKKGNKALTFPERVCEVLPSSWGAMLFLDENGVGLLDENGRICIPGSYEQGKVLTDDRVAFCLHGQWGMFDFNGKAFLEFVCDSISPFYDGEHALAYQGGSCKVIRRDGTFEGAHAYGGVKIDRVAERKLPQVFYRYPPAGKGMAADGTDGKRPEAVADSLSGTVRGDVFPGGRYETSANAFPMGEAAAQAVSRENPFFEEAQKIYAGKLAEPDAERRKVILEYVERFRSAYTTKDLPFIEQVFSEDALIVVGKVVEARRNREGNYLSGPEVQYNVKSKKEYLARLKEVFRANKKIRVRFSGFKIMRHPTRENIYGVTMRQGYASDLYSDDGYLFLLWDFSDEKAPKIHVRTWQPSMLDAKTPLPLEKVFSIRNFNFE